MQELVTIILATGRTAIDLALYLLLPVMVVMLALMKILEARGLLVHTARFLSPPLRIFGIPGNGAFAMLQLLLVSFAAPVATLSIMDRDGTDQRRIAATLAMVLAMPQANVVFPLTAVGLNLGGVIGISLAGGLAAAALTYYLLTRSFSHESTAERAPLVGAAPSRPKLSTWGLMIGGGQEAVQIVLNAIPALLLALFLVNLLKTFGAIALAETALTPFFALLGLPGAAVLPIATKYLAGGTAMMGVTLDLLKGGLLTVTDLNRLAGFVINPLDMVGVAVLAASGTRVGAIVRPAVIGGIFGILIRALLHLILF